MDTNLLKYLTTTESELYTGPEHWVEDTSNFPSVSSIVNESSHKTGIRVFPEHQADFDQEWLQSLRQTFEQHPNPNVASQLQEFLTCGVSNGRKLKLQIMVLPPGLYFKVHAHPNIEFEVTLSGCLQEFRWLFTVPAEQLVGDAPSGPEIAATHAFEQSKVQAGQCILNDIGSVHQSFTGPEKPCSILVLWSGCHANTHPTKIYSTDPRIKPTAGWDDDGTTLLKRKEQPTVAEREDEQEHKKQNSNTDDRT